MTRNIIVLLLLAAALPALAAVNSDEVSPERFAAEYPWMVALVSESSGAVCGGILIAPQWVLTAAHCLSNDRKAHLGDRDRTSASMVDIESSVRHPDFDGRTLQYDVGLFRLAETVDAPPAVLALPDRAASALVEANSGRVLGWGHTERYTGAASALREGPLTIDAISRQGTLIMIESRGGGPCNSDSGGPLVFRGDNGRFYAVGIASGTDGNLCAKNGGISAYTSISAVRSFIRQHVAGVKFD